ncbi:hypothetical protein HYS95_00430 [Candidatus Daviesbacteria bacterium]|nr:hypothetical protein [Candidatus Daviesbacteria bacterium]
MDPKVKKVIFKTVLFILSLSMAWYLFKGGFLQSLANEILPFKFIAEFLAGMLYTSFLTSPVSVAMIAALAKTSNPVTLALLAGLGAAFSDLLIVRFFRGVSKDINLISEQLRLNQITALLKKWKIEFLVPLIGIFIVASPLPDEVGLMMLGASKLKYFQLAILTYVLNTAGILLIVIPFNLL